MLVNKQVLLPVRMLYQAVLRVSRPARPVPHPVLQRLVTVVLRVYTLMQQVQLQAVLRALKVKQAVPPVLLLLMIR